MIKGGHGDDGDKEETIIGVPTGLPEGSDSGGSGGSGDRGYIFNIIFLALC